MDILQKSRFDRLRLYYEHLGSSINEFSNYEYNGLNYFIPRLIQPDKNIYRKQLVPPVRRGSTKKYYIKLYGSLYQLYKTNNNYHFIDSTSVSLQDAQMGFGCSPAYSYIAMMTFELLNWWMNHKNKYSLFVQDEVFYPLFDYPQWKSEDYTLKFVLTWRPSVISNDDRVVALSIFK